MFKIMEKKNRQGKRLTLEEKNFVLGQLAQWARPPDIVRDLKTRYGRTITERAIYQIKERDPDAVQEAREQYLADLGDTPLAHTKIRIRAWQEMYEQAKKKRGKNGEITPSWHYVAEALQGIREEMSAVQIDLNIHGTKKEAAEFLASIGSGQDDSVCIPITQGAKNSN